MALAVQGTSFAGFKVSASLEGALILPSGGKVEQTTFLKHPLFVSTAEKEDVFLELVALSNKRDFSKEYESFLGGLRTNKWFEPYRERARELALLGIIAFFDGRIDKEELFVIQTVAQAFIETNLEVVGLAILVLKVKQAAAFLKQSGFPPFAPNRIEFIITNRKDESKLEEEKRTVLGEFKKRSFVARTVVKYTLAPFGPVDSAIAKPRDTIEKGIYYTTRSSVGFCDVEPFARASCVLLPPFLTLELFKISSRWKLPKVSDHHFMFGFSPDPAPFYDGVRVVSVPSPLFNLPYVHGYLAGPRDLGLYFHDLNYHLGLEANNPHVEIIIDMARALQQSSSGNPKWDSASKALEEKLIDREAFQYKLGKPNDALGEFLSYQINEYVLPFFEKEEDFEKEDFKGWYWNVWIPIVKRVEEDLNLRPMSLTPLFLIDADLEEDAPPSGSCQIL